jgi:hypothetical protein
MNWGVNGRVEILPAYPRVTPAVCAMSESGASRDRTGDLHAASVALSQLSYGPERPIVAAKSKSSAQFTPRRWLFRVGEMRSWIARRPCATSIGM